jgi:hypothetical protein
MSYICPACVGEPFLSRLVSTVAVNEDPCEYCASDTPTAEISFVAQRCSEVIATFFEVSSLTMAVVHFSREPAGESLAEVVERLTSIPSKAVDDVVEELAQWWYDRGTGEELYGDDPYFVPRRNLDSPLIAVWTEIENSLRTEARYLNPKVGQFMDQVFGGLAEHVTVNGNSVFVDAGPDTPISELYRARVFQSEKSLEAALQHPERTLGAPPAGLSVGGRMNAPGQPAFYGAMDERTAIAEVRPPVGSWAAVARFRITRPLKLLDLLLLENAQLKSSSSLFDSATVVAAQRLAFLRELVERMTTPVMPENQDYNYLITQVAADYLAMLPNLSVDGIIYPSAQGAGSGDRDSTNVVLFHKASIALHARAEQATAVAELRTYIDEEPGSYYSPAIMFLERRLQPYNWKLPGFLPEPALELVPDGINLHRIKAVEFKTEADLLQVITSDPRSR